MSLPETASSTVVWEECIVTDYGVVFGYTRDADVGRAENIMNDTTCYMVCSISQDGGSVDPEC